MVGCCRDFYLSVSNLETEEDEKTVEKIFRRINESNSAEVSALPPDTVPLAETDNTPSDEPQTSAIGVSAHKNKNLTKNDFLKALRAISEAEDANGSDFLLLYVLSHGDRNKINVRGESVTVTEVLDIFHEDRCARFRGKPKIVILQSCRGRENEGSVSKNASPLKVGKVISSKDPTPPLQSELNERHEKMGLNFFLIYANPPGNMAYGSSSGSDFTIALGEAVETHVKPGEEITWTKLMTHVNQRYIARHQTDDQDFAGIAFISNTFTKNFIVGQGCDRQ